ncbi:MAG TPA: outer membrane protein assembly factor BamA [Kiritimatiellia bacterium]|nr:outer membrane protein assembly factor BamA [Kiritimatiellia bacterium]
MSLIRRMFYSVLLVFTLGVAWAEAVMVDEVRSIRRDGRPVDMALVEAYTSIRPGMDIRREVLSRDVRALQESGRFSFAAVDVRERPSGLEVIFILEPKPRIRVLTIQGADYAGNRKIRELLELGVGDFVDDTTLAVRSLAVREWYQKRQFPFARLTWTFTEREDGALTDVRIQVKEGQRARVRDIRFEGNATVPSRDIRRVMLQKSRHVMSWLTGSGVYNPDQVAIDLVTIRQLYLDRGYLDVEVTGPELIAVSEKQVVLEFRIIEGQQYQIGDVSFSGISLFDEEVIRSVAEARMSPVASQVELNAARQAIRDYYGSRGYISTLVSFRLSPDLQTDEQGNPVVDVDFTVREGQLASIRNVLIQGNTTTRDKVIRRELAVYPGERMDEVRARTSERRLMNLGYFSSVNSSTVETRDPEKVDLVFDVEEKPTGQFLVGAGFSSIDSLIGFAELSQGNFDLFNWPPVGGGQKLTLRGTVGTKRRDIEFGFTEPWFLNRQLSLGLNLFQRDRRFLSDDYDQRNTGGNVVLGVPVGRFSRINYIYGLEEIQVRNVSENASDLIKSEAGTALKSSFTTEYIYQTIDSMFVPTRGTRLVLAASVAGGPLGADVDVYGFRGRVSHYFPLWNDHVFNLRLESEVVDRYGDSDRVRVFDRLFLGGARSLRGFRFRDVGPKDEFGEPVGGQTMWSATAEYIIPLGRMVRWAAFYDIGMVYPDVYQYNFNDYNSDVGVGVRLDFPGFPLRFDYAWPLEADEFNDRSSGRFQFSIGYSL